MLELVEMVAVCGARNVSDNLRFAKPKTNGIRVPGLCLLGLRPSQYDQNCLRSTNRSTHRQASPCNLGVAVSSLTLVHSTGMGEVRAAAEILQFESSQTRSQLPDRSVNFDRTHRSHDRNPSLAPPQP